jgi:hypothetical protein
MFFSVVRSSRLRCSAPELPGTGYLAIALHSPMQARRPHDRGETVSVRLE